MGKLNTCSWGGLRLYAESFETDKGRSLAIHGPARGSSFVVQDRGPALAGTSVEVVFSDVIGEDDYHDRHAAFRALVDKGQPQLFVHPVYGSYRAAVGSCPETIDAAADEIRCRVEFVPAVAFDPVATTGAGVTPIAGPESVAGAGAFTYAELAKLGITFDPDNDVVARAQEAADGWATSASDVGADPRGVYLEYAEIASAIDQAALDLELFELANWTAYRALVAVRERLREAALAATSPTVRTRKVAVTADVPLLVLMAREVGATRAAAVADQVAALNDLRDRALVPAGTVLDVPLEAV